MSVLSKKKTAMRRFFIGIFAVALLLSAQSALAWGGWAHKFITYTAERHLEPEVKAKIEKALGSSMMKHCTWMDQIRKPIRKKDHPDHAKMQAYRPSLLWHGMTVDKNHYPSDKRSPKGSGALYPNLEKSIENLRDYRNMTDSAVAVNLKYMIHMMQDMHCPGHILYTEFPDCFGGKEVGPAGRAFMRIYYEGKKSNFHKIWDGLSILALYPECGKDYELFRQKMDKYSAKQRAKMCQGTLLDWAKDASKRSRPIYNRVEPNDHLDRKFLLKYRKISEGQAMRCAYRLAHLLNEIFR
jgi:hypothetical protein